MIDPKYFEEWEERDLEGFTAEVKKLTEAIGISEEAQRAKVQRLQELGLSREDAVFFLTFFMEEPDEDMLQRAY